MRESYLTVSELAERFQVTTVTVRYWIKKGNVKTMKRWEQGKKPYTVASLEDIEEYIHPAILEAAGKTNSMEQ